jgi:hypothetical protein
MELTLSPPSVSSQQTAQMSLQTPLFHGNPQSPYGNLSWQGGSLASPFVAPATRTQGHHLPLVTFHPVQGEVCVDVSSNSSAFAISLMK